jgi:energy-coupling factor transport system substrate-specific component
METGSIKTTLYLALALMVYILSKPFGIQFNWMLYAVALAVLVLLLLYADFEQHDYDSRMISLLSVITAVTVVSRQIIHGVEFSPVFFLTILAGYTFGFTPGFAVGSTVMLVSNFFIGQGPWTPFQMLGLGFIGGFAAFIPRLKRFELHLLVFYSIVTAYGYSVFMDSLFWITFIPSHSNASLIALISAGLIASTSRAVGNIFFMTLLGPPVLKVFNRFKRRFTCQYTD